MIISLTSDNFIQTANFLDKASKNENLDSGVLSKGKAFLQVATTYPHIITPSIRPLQCILPLTTREKGYPEILEWFGSTAGLCTPDSIISSAFSSLVGSVKPVIDTEQASKLAGCFGWKKPPDIPTVLRNFKIVLNTFRSETKTHLLDQIENVYEYLSKQNTADVTKDLLEQMVSDTVANMNIILCGEQFVCPRKVYFEDAEIGINLQPYLYQLSNEFVSHSTLFSGLGCHQSITKDLLLETLKEIGQKHDIEEGNVSAQAMRRDLQIVMAIINWFRDKLDEGEIKKMTILVPIDTKDTNRLCLRPARDCTYYDLTFLKERSTERSDDKTMFAHLDIAETTARKLGVMTRERKCLKDNSMLISFGQNERLITRLKRLLKGYPCDSGIMKERIPNADDAKATEIHFIKDYRTHSTEKLFDESFSPLQGPALLVFNNSAFNKDDLKGIQDLGIGRKAEDPTKRANMELDLTLFTI